MRLVVLLVSELRNPQLKKFELFETIGIWWRKRSSTPMDLPRSVRHFEKSLPSRNFLSSTRRLSSSFGSSEHNLLSYCVSSTADLLVEQLRRNSLRDSRFRSFVWCDICQAQIPSCRFPLLLGSSSFASRRFEAHGESASRYPRFSAFRGKESVTKVGLSFLVCASTQNKN